MNFDMQPVLFAAGIGQLGVLIASSLVPMRLNWRTSLSGLPTLHRQLYWVYGAYTVMSIIALGGTCLYASDELAAGGKLASAICVYGAVFWGLRLSLQAVLDAKPFLTRWWLTAGYYLLTGLFTTFTAVYLATLFL